MYICIYLGTYVGVCMCVGVYVCVYPMYVFVYEPLYVCI